MTENLSDHSSLVDEKMKARAERHIREHEAIEAEQVRETTEALAAKAVADQAALTLIKARQLRETAAVARRNRPALVAQYKLAPAGVRLVATLRDVCLNCGSENIRTHTDTRPNVYMCSNCGTEWFASHCWSCASGQLDSRDPETAPCKQCGSIKCTDCGGCNPRGCSTNPYSTSHRQRDEATATSPD